jgi:hypothetical protein
MLKFQAKNQKKSVLILKSVQSVLPFVPSLSKAEIADGFWNIDFIMLIILIINGFRNPHSEIAMEQGLQK